MTIGFLHSHSKGSELPGKARQAFDAIADSYDDTFSNSAVGRMQREAVWVELDRVFSPGLRILEMNCGTGIDALHLSRRGVAVVACDSSPGMLAVASRRIESASDRVTVDLRCLSIEDLASLEPEGPYDGAFSNFAGLNCVSDLSVVAHDLARLIRPGGKLFLCVFGRVCLWEIAWYVRRGKIRKAFRRLRPGNTPVSLSEGTTFNVRYPSVATLREVFSPYFQLDCWAGVGVTVPPSYVSPIAERFPRLLTLASKADRRLGHCPGTRALADHAMLTFTRSS